MLFQAKLMGAPMTLEAIYYIGQTIAVAAILASLVAIWFQMRQSQKMERAAAQRELLLRVSEWSREFTTSGSDGDNYIRGLMEYENGESAVQMEINRAMSEFVFICESALNMRKDGFFSEGTWIGIEGATLALLRTPGGQQWWQYGQQWIGPEIVEHLRARLEEVDPNLPTFLDFTPTFRKRLVELAQEQAKSDSVLESPSTSGSDDPTD